jgi:hypothetical protein
MDVARQQGLPNNLAITEYAYVSVAIFRSLQANKDTPEGPVAGMQDYAAVCTSLAICGLWCARWLHKHACMHVHAHARTYRSIEPWCNPNLMSNITMPCGGCI